MRRRLEDQLCPPRRDRACATARRCGAARPAHGRWACACRARTDGPGGAVRVADRGNARSIGDAPATAELFRRQGKKEMRLDQFQPLVHQGGAVERKFSRPSTSWDAPPPVPAWRRPHALERPFAERPARGGERDEVDLARIARARAPGKSRCARNRRGSRRRRIAPARRRNTMPAATTHSLLASATVAPRAIAASAGFDRRRAHDRDHHEVSEGLAAAAITAPRPAATSMPVPDRAVFQLRRRAFRRRSRRASA